MGSMWSEDNIELYNPWCDFMKPSTLFTDRYPSSTCICWPEVGIRLLIYSTLGEQVRIVIPSTISRPLFVLASMRFYRDAVTDYNISGRKFFEGNAELWYHRSKDTIQSFNESWDVFGKHHESVARLLKYCLFSTIFYYIFAQKPNFNQNW